jgi:hypothetical protein
MMVNYAIFFAAMVPDADDKTSGRCGISKVAIPVPGYPLGFYKNPDLVTYYAVKGEAEFEGMFNPFSDDTIRLSAYAAAKPMGGRIGPMLFTQKPGEDSIKGRTDPSKLRSIPYLTSYQFEGATIKGETYSEVNNGNKTIKKFITGLPIPTNSKEKPGPFWLESPNNPVGGKVANPEDIQFGVPNLVYDYQVPFESTGYTLQQESIHTIKASDPRSEKPVGLFSPFQFKKFMGSDLNPANPITDEDLKDEIARIRAPTLYEAANYLIPTHHDFNINQGLDSFGFITSPHEEETRKNNITIYKSQVYAPLYSSNDQQDLIFKNQKDVTDTIFEYMGSQESGMKKYLMAMNRVAKNIFDTKVSSAAIGSKVGYQKAAKTVSDVDFNQNDYLESIPDSCTSLAGQFLYFYFGEVINSRLAPKNTKPPNKCPVPLGKLLEEYYSKATNDPNYDPNYYAFEFSYNNNIKVKDQKNYMTAYMPGPFTGANLEGEYVNPLYVNPLNPNINSTMRRNFYSTKFISLNSVQNRGKENYKNESFDIHSEGSVNRSQGADTQPKDFINSLEVNDSGLNSIEH